MSHDHKNTDIYNTSIGYIVHHSINMFPILTPGSGQTCVVGCTDLITGSYYRHLRISCPNEGG